MAASKKSADPAPDGPPAEEPQVAGGAPVAPGDGDGVSAEGAPEAPSGTDAAPLTPDEATVQRSPHLGVPESSTNPVAANAAVMSPPGSAHVRLVGEDGNRVGLDEVFEFPGPGNPRMVATVKQRVYQEFFYPNTSTPATHLLYPAGAEVPVPEAMRVVETFKHAAAEELPA